MCIHPATLILRLITGPSPSKHFLHHVDVLEVADQPQTFGGIKPDAENLLLGDFGTNFPVER